MIREIDEIKDDLERAEYMLEMANKALAEAERVDDQTAIGQGNNNVEAAQRSLIQLRQELQVAELVKMLGDAREHLAFAVELHRTTVVSAKEQVAQLEARLREAGIDPDNL